VIGTLFFLEKVYFYFKCKVYFGSNDLKMFILGIIVVN